MKMLVCGGRTFGLPDEFDPDKDPVGERMFCFDLLDDIAAVYKPELLIHGDAPGADRLAAAWARLRRLSTRAIRARWSSEGRAAGPIRNRRMFELTQPDLVVALPGGPGTRDMREIARENRCRLIEVVP